jgi:CHAD domain-containing protein
MNFDLQQATARLRTLRSSLLANYNDEDLHQLRVTLRRMRSVLRGVPGGKAQKLRRRLGALAATTNDARDWDTLYTSAMDQLRTEQFNKLEPLLHERRESARAQVYRMFHAKQWLTALCRWDGLAGKTDLDADSLSMAQGELAARLRRANKTADKAMAKDDEKRWHKLRIAIKELRYALDTGSDEAPASAHPELLQECKTLQKLLGDWHDTVVHRQLLDTLAGSGSAGTATPSGEAARKLQQVLAQKGLESLEQIKHRLQQGALDSGEPV